MSLTSFGSTPERVSTLRGENVIVCRVELSFEGRMRLASPSSVTIRLSSNKFDSALAAPSVQQ